MDEDCGGTLQPSTERETTLTKSSICFGETLTISCNNNGTTGKIKIVQAHFGRAGYPGEDSCRASNPINCDGQEEDCGWRTVRNQIGAICNGHSECSLKVDSAFVAACPLDSKCPLCSQYLEINYMCTPDPEDCQSLATDGAFAYSDGFYSSSDVETSSCIDPNSVDEYGDFEDMGYQCGGGAAAGNGNLLLPYRRNSGFCSPANAHMNMDGAAVWCPEMCYKRKPYLQIDMKGKFRVKGAVLQGRRNWDHWVTSVFFSYSSDGQRWVDKTDQFGKIMEYKANTNAIDTVYWDFNSGEFDARFVRINVIDWYGYPAMKVEIIRCSAAMSCPPVTVANSNTNMEPAQHGEEIEVQCRSKWMTPQGETSYRLLCLSDGTWSSEVRPCSALRSCTDIPSVPGALHNAQTMLVGTKVDFYCQNGRQLQGNSSIICQPNRQWSQPPRCL